MKAEHNPIAMPRKAFQRQTTAPVDRFHRTALALPRCAACAMTQRSVAGDFIGFSGRCRGEEKLREAATDAGSWSAEGSTIDADKAEERALQQGRKLSIHRARRVCCRTP
jgi:hypothetical protein